MNRLDRLVAVLITIQSRKSVSVAELADKYSISKRTVYRDIKALSDAGVPLYTEDNKRYRIMGGYFLPPVMVTKEEATSLLIMEKLAAKFMETKLTEHFSTLATKIKSILRYSDKDYLEMIDKTILVHTEAGNYYGYKETRSLFDIQKAITNKNPVKIKYQSASSDKETNRIIEPVGITQYGLGWHLIAWCRLREAYRDFRLDRIHKYKILEENFEYRDAEPLQKYILNLSKQENK